jgi:hypothetical protein
VEFALRTAPQKCCPLRGVFANRGLKTVIG